MTIHSYGEIPDSFPTKRMFPLGEHMWNIFKSHGWEFIEKQFDPEAELIPGVADATFEKFQTAVKTANKVLNGEIKHPDRCLATWFFPPLVYVRSDLQSGSTKLIYGNSTDITFVLINDFTQDVEALINGHMEDGIPVDFWFIHGEDDIFNRRHLKLGMKLREIPKKTNDFIKTGHRIIDLLKDIRNERSPEFSQSAYSICMVWLSAGLNLSTEPSNYGAMGMVWDGLEAKRTYGMDDYWFCYVPTLPLLNMMAMAGRHAWVHKMTGLLTNNLLFINAFEPKHKEVYETRAPEIWSYFVNSIKEAGVLTPKMAINCTPPDLRDKRKFHHGNFTWHYPDGARIKPAEWGLSDDELVGGILTDITPDTPEQETYGKEHVISLGIGKEY
ncbi:MAG: hypothetical protein EAX96_16815 [Candidatus Lokiarchaeota archaeon]|nr:hypothetical protein [Candidatus Lokiarchaeota archaeon]